MNTNVNLFAPIGVMALLGTGFLFFVAALVLIQSLIVRKRRRAKFVLLVALVVDATDQRRRMGDTLRHRSREQSAA